MLAATVESKTECHQHFHSESSCVLSPAHIGTLSKMALAKTAASCLDMFVVVVFQSSLETSSLAKCIAIPFPRRKQMKSNHKPVDEKKITFSIYFLQFLSINYLFHFALPNFILVTYSHKWKVCLSAN